jgi:hypothetical protein
MWYAEPLSVRATSLATAGSARGNIRRLTKPSKMKGVRNKDGMVEAV